MALLLFVLDRFVELLLLLLLLFRFAKAIAAAYISNEGLDVNQLVAADKDGSKF